MTMRLKIAREAPWVTPARKRSAQRFGRALALWLMLIGGSLAATGCGDGGSSSSNGHAGRAEGPAAARRITDDTGRTVGLPAEVERVAAGTSFAVEYLMALDHPPVLRPDTPLTDMAVDPAKVEPIPAISVDHSVGPNVEQIVAADPDVVVLSPTFARFAKPIEQAADASAVIYRINALADVPAKARAFGELIGESEAGSALADKLHREIDGVEPPAGAEEPTVFALFGTPASFFAFLPESYLGSMVEHLGGRMITGGTPASETSSQLAPFSIETLIAEDPDVILMVHHGPAGEMADALAGREIWGELRAVKRGRVHRVSERLFMTNPGPSAARALRELRGLLYPADGADE